VISAAGQLLHKCSCYRKLCYGCACIASHRIGIERCKRPPIFFVVVKLFQVLYNSCGDLPIFATHALSERQERAPERLHEQLARSVYIISFIRQFRLIGYSAQCSKLALWPSQARPGLAWQLFRSFQGCQGSAVSRVKQENFRPLRGRARSDSGCQ